MEDALSTTVRPSEWITVNKLSSCINASHFPLMCYSYRSEELGVEGVRHDRDRSRGCCISIHQPTIALELSPSYGSMSNHCSYSSISHRPSLSMYAKLVVANGRAFKPVFC